MVLPILVPRPGELPVALIEEPRNQAPRMRRPSTGWRPAPNPTSDRQALVQRWRSRLWLPPATNREYRLAVDAADGGGEFLLERCERLLRALLRRRRQAMPRAQRNAMARIARSFEAASATVQAHRTDAALLAWMLAAMYWRGFRHPAALSCPPLHPPTRLLGWLTQFSVGQQVDQSAAVLASLPAEVARIQQRSHFAVAALLRRAHAGRVVLLPELLEPARQAASAPVKTAIAKAKSSVSQGSSFARQTTWESQ